MRPMAGLWDGWAAWEPGRESLLALQGLDGAGVFGQHSGGGGGPGLLGRERSRPGVTPGSLL